jgi:NAD(P)H dehydrogenase (quinone)
MDLCLFIGNNLSDAKVTKILIVFYSRYGNTARMAEEIAYGAKELDGIAVTLKRIADDIPMEVVSKDPSWSKIVENLNNRIPTTPIEDIMHEFLDIMQ